MEQSVFEIVLHSPIGPKKGSMTLFFDNGSIFADIFLMQQWNRFLGSQAKGGAYDLTGVLKTLVGDVPCSIHLVIDNGILSAVAYTSKGVMVLDGVQEQQNDGKAR